MDNTPAASATIRDEQKLVEQDVLTILANCNLAEDALVSAEGLTPERLVQIAVSLLTDARWAAGQLRVSTQSLVQLADSTVACNEQIQALSERVALLERQIVPRVLQ